MVAHKAALDLTDKQRTCRARRRHGAVRLNWALSEWRRRHAARKRDPTPPPVTVAALRRDLEALERSDSPGMLDATKCAPQAAIIDLGTAFRSSFDGRGRHPRFKRRGERDSFCAADESGTFRADGRRLRLPRLGFVRLCEPVRSTGTLERVTVNREADRWFASILVEVPDPAPVRHAEPCVGVDLGITTLATPSTGETIPGPKAHTAPLGRLERMDRSPSRERQGSANRARARARLHARIAAIRRDATHEATTAIAKRFARIGIEDLNVRGMVRNRSLARSIMDGSFGEFRRQLASEARMTGSILTVADRWSPSSEACSRCGAVKAELALAQRVFRCDVCGHEADHDLDAARNPEGLVARSAVTARGEDRSGAGRKPRVERASAKQEPDDEGAEKVSIDDLQAVSWRFGRTADASDRHRCAVGQRSW